MTELDVQEQPSLLGQTIDGRYRLEELVNAGALGVTYRARHIEHQRVVSLKLLHDDVSGDALRRGRFEWEAATLAALAHPNIVAIIDYGVHDGRRWVASEWLEGETLAARIARGPLSLTAATTIVRQVLAALASAHAARLLHRNVKPSNVFLERRAAQGRERVKLLDFAPAPRQAKAGTPAPVVAEPSPYRTPELGAGEALDTRSDVFMVGATLIGMLIGTPALEADAATATAPERGRALPGVDATLLAWIRRATSAQRSLRFADAADMLRELIDLLPRDLRSPPDSSDGSTRAVSMPISRPPQMPNVRPTVEPPPLPRSRRTSPPPLHAAQATRAIEPAAVPAPAGAGAVPLPAPAFAVPVAEEPAPFEPAPSVTIPPPAPVPAEAQVYVRAAAPSDEPIVEEPLGLPPLGRTFRNDGRGSLRPIESQSSVLNAEPRIRQLMAAAVFGAFLIAVLVIFLQPGGQGRANTRESAPERPRAAVETPKPAPVPRVQPPVTPIPESAIAPAKVPPAPVAVAVAPPPAAAPPAAEPALPNKPAVAVAAPAASPRSAAPTIIAGPGRPRVRDPWLDPIPTELKRVRELALNGSPGDEAKVKALREYTRDHRGDVRGYLIVGQLYCNRLWRTDCVEEWANALDRDPTVRGAPEILPSLLEMVAQGKAMPLVQQMVIKYYGKEALDSIDGAFEDVKSPEAAARLHALRLKLTGGAPQE